MYFEVIAAADASESKVESTTDMHAHETGGNDLRAPANDPEASPCSR